MAYVITDNPWAVQIENFLHYCCPECDIKDKNRDTFIQHALENHPKALEYLLKNELSNEESPFGEVKSDPRDYLDVELKVEDDDEDFSDFYAEEGEVSELGEIGEIEEDMMIDEPKVTKTRVTHVCQKCDKTYKHFGKWKTHMITQHPEDVLLNCDMCKREFSSVEMMENHKCRPSTLDDGWTN